jgi:hypothetical protein
MTNYKYQVYAIQAHDCFAVGDAIMSGFESWADADQRATRHNALYVREMGTVSAVRSYVTI